MFFQQTSDIELCLLLWQSDVYKYSESCTKSAVTIFKIYLSLVIWFAMSWSGDQHDPEKSVLNTHIDLTQFQSCFVHRLCSYSNISPADKQEKVSVTLTHAS